MSASLTDRVWEYADQTGQDSRDVYVALLQQVNLASPEIVDAAFARMRELQARYPVLPGAAVSCAKAKM